jgi:DNA ligase-associated metallophosphoesterase
LTDALSALNTATYAFQLNGVEMLADRAGCLVLVEERTLIVSDLHFEKGSAYAQRGQMLPPYDTRATLKALSDCMHTHQPKTLVALGDSFHDLGADGRMDAADAETLHVLMRRVEDWVWIEGNHDPVPPARFGGTVLETLTIGSSRLQHQPDNAAPNGLIAGHLHPCAKVRTRGRSIRARCFATDLKSLVMPAFGAFTGGLNIRDDAFTSCFGRTPDALVMGRDKVYPVKASNCVPDRRSLTSRGG